MSETTEPIHIISVDPAFGEDVSVRTTVEPLMDGSFRVIKIEYQDKKSWEWHE